MTGTILPPEAGTGGAEGPEVVVVAVTYNSASIVEPFLRALPLALAGLDSAQVVIVDNASADGTAELVRRLAPWASVIDSGDNFGYGAAINIGLEYVLPTKMAYILNPDAIPAPGSVRLLVDALVTYDDAGIVVPKILNEDGSPYPSLRREPAIRRALAEAVLGGRRAAAIGSLSEVVDAPSAYQHEAVADWATGAAMAMSRTAIDEAGFWAEDFFLYSEETEYALRVRDHGLLLRYVPKATVRHAGGDMSVSPYLWSIRAVNRVRLYRRRHGLLATVVFWGAVFLNEGLRAIRGSTVHRAALRALLTGHPALREQRRRLAERHGPSSARAPGRDSALGPTSPGNPDAVS